MSYNCTILQQRFVQKRDSLLSEYDFVCLDSLPSHLTPSLIVEVDGRKLVPMFQFTAQKKVYPSLKAVLPELKSHRSSWDICFWLTTKRTIIAEAAVPTEEQIEACKSPDDIIQLGRMADKQSTDITASPLELLASNNNELFILAYQELLDLQIMSIPSKPLVLE